MRRERVRDLLARVADGSLPVEGALDALALDPTESLGFATIDHHRALRQGFPEVIYGAGKTAEHIVAIATRIAERGDGVLVTRVSEEAATALGEALPGAVHNETARTVHLASPSPPAQSRDALLVVTAGTSDLPVAEEAAVTAQALGCRLERLTDVGVAGIHRLLSRRDGSGGSHCLVL
jgi:NCAIR mutase (PurE)-related protein